jgi:hypothetical protein
MVSPPSLTKSKQVSQGPLVRFACFAFFLPVHKMHPYSEGNEPQKKQQKV